MKFALLCCSLILLSCSAPEKKMPATMPSQENERIEQQISTMFLGLSRAYNGAAMNTDSLFDANYERDVRYVTPWGSTEPLDSTKARLRNALHHVKDFTYRIESMKVKSYADAAYASFVLRQNYQVDGNPLDEYLPTTMVLERRGSDWKIVHVHRSTDYETIKEYVALQQKRESKN